MGARRNSLVALAFFVAVLAWSATEAFGAGETGVLYVAPALLLLLPLLFGRYVGEERIAALGDRAMPARRRAARSVPAPRAFARLMHRGGRLVASSMAKRPPPSRAQHLSA
jgi:hypothetical protein